jgi:hypothetical protein
LINPAVGSESLEDYQERDKIKLGLAKARGITLFVIPFWWDGKIERYLAYFAVLLFVNFPFY